MTEIITDEELMTLSKDAAKTILQSIVAPPKNSLGYQDSVLDRAEALEKIVNTFFNKE